MDVIITRGNSYLSDDNKINPTNLTQKQKIQYMELFLKTRLIQSLNGKVSSKIIDDSISSIDFSTFADNFGKLNSDQKFLLDNLIKYQLFLRGIDIDALDFNEILSRF